MEPETSFDQLLPVMDTIGKYLSHKSQASLAATLKTYTSPVQTDFNSFVSSTFSIASNAIKDIKFSVRPKGRSMFDGFQIYLYIAHSERDLYQVTFILKVPGNNINIVCKSAYTIHGDDYEFMELQIPESYVDILNVVIEGEFKVASWINLFTAIDKKFGDESDDILISVNANFRYAEFKYTHTVYAKHNDDRYRRFMLIFVPLWRQHIKNITSFNVIDVSTTLQELCHAMEGNNFLARITSNDEDFIELSLDSKRLLANANGDEPMNLKGTWSNGDLHNIIVYTRTKLKHVQGKMFWTVVRDFLDQGASWVQKSKSVLLDVKKDNYEWKFNIKDMSLDSSKLMTMIKKLLQQ
jgi:hypothetical protein